MSDEHNSEQRLQRIEQKLDSLTTAVLGDTELGIQGVLGRLKRHDEKIDDSGKRIARLERYVLLVFGGAGALYFVFNILEKYFPWKG
jgi:hypothetical protein